LDESKQLPIHTYVNNSSAKKEIVEFLVSHNPDSIEQVDEDGNTLLAIAVDRQKSPEIVLYLLGQRPDLASKRNARNGQTPLHALCCNYNADEMVPALAALLELHGEAAKLRDKGGSVHYRTIGRSPTDTSSLL